MDLSILRSRTVQVHEEAPRLPFPPNDWEKGWYIGRQRRWLLVAQSLAFVSIGVSVLRFSLSDTRLLLFLVPLSMFAVTLLVSLASSTRGARIDRLDHELRVFNYRPATYPSVDVFLPSAGEPVQVLANTFRHVRRLDWPAEVTVWVLDDSAREVVHELADRHGFLYRTRPDPGHLKKAGNLRFGYEQSTSELIVIFDADFVPRRDFLHELVPYFEDADVGIVQSPQFFDAVKGMHWLQRCAGATQELFYRWIQRARDRSDAAICVGTCAIYRRTALDAAGGFAQIGHSEDVHTGVNLMKAGFHLRYVPVLLSKGICPNTAIAFVTQQYRWCTGSMSLLADRSFHNDPHLGVRQKVCYWAGFLYYITTAVNVFVTAVPALVMLWLLPQFVYPRNSVWLLGAVFMWLVVLPITFRSRWRIDVLRVQSLYSFAHAVAIFHIMTGRTRAWVATGTANSRSTAIPLGVTILRVAKTWVVITQLAVWTGLARGIHVHGIGHMWAMTCFALLAAYVQLPILALPTETRLHPVRSAADATSSVVSRFIRQAGRPVIIHLPGTSGYRVRRQSRTRQVGLRAFRPDIQGLRAIAVLLVVLYHAHIPYITGGYVGVDVFFVISGFLITGGLLRQVEKNGRISFRSFYAGRIRRLAVPAAIVVLVTLLAARLWDSLFQVQAVAMDAVFASVYAINYRFAALGVNYQLASGPPSPLQHYWSLAVEEQFYALWPVLIMICVWVFRRHHRAAVAVVLVAVSAASLAANLRLTESNQPMAYFSIHTRAWELGAGALVTLAARRLTRMPASVAATLSWLGLGLIVCTGLLYDDSTLFPGVAAIAPVAGATIVIAAGCRPSRGSAELLLGKRPMQAIGRVSYAWYLWHWPMLIIFPMVLQRDLSWPVEAEVAVLSLWAAMLMFYLIESPALRSRLRHTMWLALGLALALVTGGSSMAVAASVPSLVGTGTAVTLEASNTGAIMHAVAVGTLTGAAPSNLKPALAKIRADQPTSTLNGCHAGFLVVQQGACVYGDPDGVHTMVLIGDSHAQQWLPALDTEAKAKKWKLIAWTKAACPIADLSVHAEQLGNRLFTECDQWRKITLGKVDGTHPDVLVVTQSDSVPGRQFSNTEWADATARTLTRSLRAGTPVVYLLDTPVPRTNVPDCVANNLTNVQPCMFRRTQVYSFPGRHEQMASTLKAVGVTTVEPIDWFCTATKCPVVVGDLLVYRDASHISTPYSAYLAPATAALFVPKKTS
jgi:peptidoglycan/LPS O-acetylase OafA/YrhL/cellulose synthase/poly-beta-1,6-N-acetylglucosamine synthase-like glycosyltransferase